MSRLDTDLFTQSSPIPSLQQQQRGLQAMIYGENSLVKWDNFFKRLYIGDTCNDDLPINHRLMTLVKMLSQVQEPISNKNFTVEWLLHSEIKHCDWMLQVL